MNTGSSMLKRLLVAVAATALMSGAAYAAKPDDAGKGKGNAKSEQSHKGGKPDHAGNKGNGNNGGNSQGGQGSSGGSKASVSGGLNLFFSDDKRSIIHDYYSNQFKGGHCPPGLAKKNNGCMPPGQAKKWRVGYPLPHDVIFHDLPDDLLRRLGRTEEGYRLVRVGADILKIGVGTGLVVEAVEDLGDLF